MWKFNKEQVNNELRTNDFNKEVSITRKKAKKTANVPRWTIRIF